MFKYLYDSFVASEVCSLINILAEILFPVKNMRRERSHGILVQSCQSHHCGHSKKTYNILYQSYQNLGKDDFPIQVLRCSGVLTTVVVPPHLRGYVPRAPVGD